MDASWLAALIIGAAQPFLTEIITRGKWVGADAARLSLVVSFGGGLVAFWLTGGLAGAQIPAFTLLDPSPLVLFVLAIVAKVNLVSRITYAIPGVGPTGPVSAPTKGLVQKVAGTEAPTPPIAPPGA